MDIIGTSLNGVPLLTLVGEADHSVGPELAQAAQRAMSCGSTRILLNLELCSYLDSGALGVILGLVQQVEPGGWVGVVSCSHMVLRLFNLAGLAPGERFRVLQSLDDARAAAAAV